MRERARSITAPAAVWFRPTEPIGRTVVFARSGLAFPSVIMLMDRWTELAAHWGIEPAISMSRAGGATRTSETLRRIVEALSAAGNPPAAVDAAGTAAGARLSGRRPQALGAGGAALRRALAAQLGPRRFHRSRGAAGDRRRSRRRAASGSIRCTRSSMTGPDRAARIRRTAGCFSIRSTSTSRRSRNFDRAHARSSPREIARLRDAELVDYPAVATLKLAALARGLPEFRCERQRERRARFRQPIGEERGRALRMLRRVRNAARDSIPAPGGNGRSNGASRTTTRCADCAQSHPDEIGFHEFLQWNAERQLAALPRHRARSAACRSGSISTPRSASIPAAPMPGWTQGAMLRGLSVGAPPDQFNPAGQDWGLTAYNPHGLVATTLRAVPADAARGHALRRRGPHRSRARPDAALSSSRTGFGAAQGAYLRLPFADMLAVVAEESRRWHCIVIGEDLGTVPEGFRATLVGLGRVVLSGRCCSSGTGTARFAGPSEYPRTRHRDVQHPRSADLRGLDERPRSCGSSAPSASIPARPRTTAHSSRAALCAALTAATGSQRIGFEDVAAFLARDADAAGFDRDRGCARSSKIRSTCRAR